MPIKLIEGIPEPTATRTFRVVPLKLKIKFNGVTTGRTVRVRRELPRKRLTPQALAAKLRALKRLATCGTSQVPAATKRARALLAARTKLSRERQARERAERRLAAANESRRRAAEDRATERRRRILQGAAHTHKHRLYDKYHRDDTTLYPKFYLEGREPGNPFFQDAYHTWLDNTKTHQARLAPDCESSC